MPTSWTHRRIYLRKGLEAGLGLALADWLASGPRDTPGSILLLTLSGGLLLGAMAGALGALARLPGLPLGFVLAVGVGLEGGSHASKDLGGAGSWSGERWLGWGVVAVLALAVGLGCVLRRQRHRRLPGAWTALLLASLPAASLAVVPFRHHPWLGVLAPAGPLLLLGLERRFPDARALPRMCAFLAPALLALPSLLSEARPRADEPPPRVAAARSQGPSVVLLVIDTLRADALVPGGPLLEFARDGVLFEQCVSAAPWTLPAIGSLFTSLYPSQHGAVNAATPLPEELTTLAEALQAAGYRTGGFTGGGFVGPAYRLDQGFEVFDPLCERRFPPFRVHEPLVWRLAKNGYLPLSPILRWVDEYRGFAGVLETAQAWLGRAPAPPVFLFLHTYQVHDYYVSDPELDPPLRASLPPLSERFAGRLTIQPSELGQASAQDLDHLRGLYQGREADVERRFAAAVSAIERVLGEDTLWIVTADHGEGFDAAHGRVHHGGRLHDDLLRVPLILRAPGRLEPARVASQVRSVDVYPTVLELLGLPVPAELAGHSLLGALRGTEPFPAPAFSEERAHGLSLRSLRQAGWKLISSGAAPGQERAFHLEEDPLELAPRPPPPELEPELRGFERRYPPRDVREVEIDAHTRGQLQALGYGDSGERP